VIQLVLPLYECVAKSLLSLLLLSLLLTLLLLSLLMSLFILLLTLLLLVLLQLRHLAYVCNFEYLSNHIT
jgi:hypothetical protein